LIKTGAERETLQSMRAARNPLGALTATL